MITDYLRHLTSDLMLFSCSIVMLSLFCIDFFGLLASKFKFAKCQHRSFGPSIVGIGLLTTFIGILSGLYGFNANNIAGSVPQLLEGLRFAFAGSVLGMFLSLVLSVSQKLLFSSTVDEEILHSIDRNISSLVTSLQEPGEMIKQFTEMKTFLKAHLEHINSSLDKALTELARGATQEVVKALERVITDFNNNLTEQFGENFKELNSACLKLVDWQRNYKGHVEKTEQSLGVIMQSLEQSCKSARELTESNHKTQQICSEVANLIKAYDLQVRTLESHLQSCKALGQEAALFLKNTQDAINRSTENMDKFSGVIENSVSKQSESLARLTQEIDMQLPKALGELENVLCSLTNQFAEDYRSLFQYITKAQ